MIASDKGIVMIDGKGMDIIADFGVLTKEVYEKVFHSDKQCFDMMLNEFIRCSDKCSTATDSDFGAVLRKIMEGKHENN
jgi:hypothetical protein|nr:MAG TPA: hypothetical protein [Bacteriophage sp.]